MKRILMLLLFSGAVLFLFFFRLEKIPLWSSDEGRYGEIAREIWESGQFIPLRFNYVDYLQKPILSFLLAAFSYVLFGVSSLSARLPSVISALLGILLCYTLARRFFDEQTAGLSAAVLTTAIGYVLMGRFAMIDMLMALLLSATFFCLMTACLEDKKKYYFAAYVFMGLIFLTKGLIGIVLPALVFLTFLVWTKNLREIRKMSLGWGALIVTGIILPWIIALSVKEPEFLSVFILQHHLARFATKSFGRVRPFWFYVPVFLGLNFPWSVFLPAAWVSGMKKEKGERLKVQFLIAWIAVLFLFFSIPRTKLPYYLLPTSIPFAILVGHFFSDRMTPGAKPQNRDLLVKWSWNLVLLVCVLAAAGSNLFILFMTKDKEILTLKPTVHIGSSIMMGSSFLAYFFRKKKKEKAALFSLWGVIYVGLIITIAAMDALTPFESTFAFAEALRAQLKEKDSVAIFSSPDHFSDFPFHLRRRVIIVGPDRGSLTDESLKPEEAEGMKKWFLDEGVFVHFFNSRENRVFCLMDEKHFSTLRDLGLKDYKIVKSGYRKLLISNT